MYHIWYCVSTPRTVTERRLTLVNLDQASVGSAQATVDRPHVRSPLSGLGVGNGLCCPLPR